MPRPSRGVTGLTAVEHELWPGDPTSVARGRAMVTAALAGPQWSRAMVEDAVLAASELVTNAIAVAHSRICLSIEVLEGRARVAVYDDGLGNPVARPSSTDRPHGRGLSIVEIVSARWGVSPEPPGKWVWAEFPVALPAS